MKLSRRRLILATLGSLGLGTGCLESGPSVAESEPVTDTDAESLRDTGPADQSVTVIRTRESSWTPSSWKQTLTVSTATGSVTETLVCGDQSMNDSATLLDTALEPFRALAGADDLDTLQTRYACEERCPTDVPPTTVTIATTTTGASVTVEPGASTPALLNRTLDALSTAAERVSAGSCSSKPTSKNG